MLLLASASVARGRLLSQAGIPHRVRVSGIDESALVDADPIRQVALLAQAKALAVAAVAGPDLLGADGTPCQALVACDSLLSFEGELFGKPRDAAEATARWRRMGGQWADLHTGHCLLLAGEPLNEASGASRRLETITTRVLFAALDHEAIARYVASGEPLACAGGFALEGRGSLLVERLEGCYTNVIGLSMPWLRRSLPGMGLI